MKPVLAIVGPTAVGKTRLSVALAKRYGGEIISADAMQFYRGLDIGTAKATPEERQGVAHHLIDILDPQESFSVAQYQRVVRDKIAELQARDVLPIVVGGSGLYVRSVLYDYRFEGKPRDLETVTQYDALSNEELFALLREKDPLGASQNHPNNRKRILRLLELAESAGTVRSQAGKESFYEHLILVGLRAPREELYRRIERRVDEMMGSGLLGEVKNLHDRGIRGQSVMAIGYKELYEYLEEKTTLAEALLNIKQASRRYAKRQMTWFTNQMSVEWFDSDPKGFEATIISVCDRLDPFLS
jgi:tRNA dimethylallyltransferase